MANLILLFDESVDFQISYITLLSPKKLLPILLKFYIYLLVLN